jgi:predicted ArsR family transcriptional regulator
MGTLDLFTPLARRTDPWTSHAAADSMKETAQAQRDMVERALMNAGPMTADEIDAYFGWRPTPAGRRTSQLERADLIVKTGDRRPTRSGRPADVYRHSRDTRSDPTGSGPGD